MSNFSQSLAAALSDPNVAGNLARIVDPHIEPPSRGRFCSVCIFLDVLTSLFGISMHSQLEERVQSMTGSGTEVFRDLDLGRRSDLVARSSNCLTCSALLSCADEQVATTTKDAVAGLNADYSFSAHLMDNNPVLVIAYGPTPTTTTNIGDRRSYFDQLIIMPFMLAGGKLPMSAGAWPEGSPRLHNPEHIDTAQIRGWFHRCDQLHGNKCKQSDAFYVSSEVRPSFIDVERECVVTPDSVVPYVALSYVWGPVETLQALKENVHELACPGSLSTSSDYNVPATIRDAIKLCALVGQKYLWVDRVCIVQDDFETKLEHLNAMAQIYAKAEFTIVAADGSHADQGLSGLGQNTGQRRRHLFRFPTKIMIRVTDEVTRQKRLSRNVWSSRAWTFQEHVFSRRLLYMDTLVSWICYSATWNELWSLPPASVPNEEERSDQHGKGEKLYTVDWPSFAEYANMVEQYNSRDLTYDSDILNAFIGVIAQMREGFPAGFYGGLPEFYFTLGLLWQAGEGLRPRVSSNNCAPTWSWLGWSGKLDLTMWKYNTDAQLPHSEFETTITPVVRFFKKPNRADMASDRIDDTFHTVRTHFTINNGAPPDRWEKHPGDAESNLATFYTYTGYYGPSHIDPKRRFRYPIPPFQRHRDVNPIDTDEQKLYFSTQRKLFTFGTPEEQSSWRFGEHKDGRYHAVDVPVHDENGAWAGSVRVNGHVDEKLPCGEEAELIRVAEGSIPTTSSKANPCGEPGSNPQVAHGSCHPLQDCVQRGELRSESHYDFYFVLWIIRDGEVARRKALGTIWKRSWHNGETEDVDIILV
ncbi:heterokaryon incompatibility protein [Stagonosporopsis vannaccii]|nr:heterokaryon incompatibility protein [Stagonosporopsis vannaccii]